MDYLVPLMDVLFILITFFVIAFSMSRMETEVNISVPASESTDKALQDVGQIVVNVRADGTLVLSQQVLPGGLMGSISAVSCARCRRTRTSRSRSWCSRRAPSSRRRRARRA